MRHDAAPTGRAPLFTVYTERQMAAGATHGGSAEQRQRPDDFVDVFVPAVQPREVLVVFAEKTTDMCNRLVDNYFRAPDAGFGW